MKALSKMSLINLAKLKETSTLTQLGAWLTVKTTKLKYSQKGCQNSFQVQVLELHQ